MERRRRRVELGAVLGQVRQRLGLAVLSLPGPERRREVHGGESDELLITLRQRPTRSRRADAQLPDQLFFRDERRGQRVGDVRHDAGRSGDGAIRPNDDRPRQIERTGEARQGRLHAGVGRLGHERRLTERAKQALAGHRPW